MSEQKYIIERRVTRDKQTLASLLYELADDMEDGDFAPADAAAILIRDAEDGILTFVFWGEADDLLERGNRLQARRGPAKPPGKPK